MSNFPKRCGNCGTEHTPESWAALPHVGDADYAGEILSLRNCGCGSTLAIDLTPPRMRLYIDLIEPVDAVLADPCWAVAS